MIIMKTAKMLCIVVALLATVVNVRAAEWEKPTPPDCTPADGQSYYFYLPFAEQIVSAAVSLATLDDKGSPFVFTAQGDEWMLESSKGYLYADLDIVACDGGPNGFNTLWYLERQATGCYRIRPSKTSGDFTWAEYPDQWMGLSSEDRTMKTVIMVRIVNCVKKR